MDKESSTSTIDLNQKIVPSDFKLSCERGKHLIAPFELESQVYECQCESCTKAKASGPLFSRIYIIGVVFPLLWFWEIAFCIYLQWVVPHVPLHPPIEPEQLPTNYELEVRRKRTEITLDPLTLQDIRITNHPIKNWDPFPFQTSDLPEPEVASDGEAGQEFRLQRNQYLFLRNIATQVIDTHRRQRSNLWKWIWFSMAAAASYGLILAVILGTTIKHS